MAFHNLWVCEQRAVSSQGVSVLLGLPGVLSLEQLLTGLLLLALMSYV